MNHIQQGDDAPELARRFSTLVEALLAAPPERPFITMWSDEGRWGSRKAFDERFS